MDTKKKVEQLPDHGPLTPEILRTFEGFEETTDEEAYEIIRTLDTYARIVVAYYENINRPKAIHPDEESVPKKKRGRKKGSKKNMNAAVLCNPIALINVTPVKFTSKRKNKK
jgi:hypothetical protein